LLDTTDIGRHEWHQPYDHGGPRGDFGDAPHETFVECGDNDSVGVAGVDLERAMSEVDAEASVLASRWGRREREAFEEPDHLLGHLLRRRMTETAAELVPTADTLLLSRGHGLVA
jgi:hypothetical protein